MRKQTKLVAVASAAALLAIGASMTSFAATGWVEENGEWYYYEKDGSKAEDTWKKSGDKWFWLDSEENGAMAIDKLVEDDDNTYYVDSTGAMVSNTWVKVVNEDQDDEDDPAEYNYYYMQSNGKAYKASNNNTTKFKTIDGKRYTFDEDGKMLYGWIDDQGARLTGDSDWENATYYCGNWDDGAMKTGWQKVNVWDDDEDDDMDYWFNFKSNGKKRVNENTAEANIVEKKINGKKYGFDNRGVMVYEWTVATGAQASTSSWRYFNSPEDGARVTKGWFKVVAPTEDNSFGKVIEGAPTTSNTFSKGKAEDETEKWYYADGDGKLYAGAIKKIKGKYYGFHEEGWMLNGLCALVVDSNGELKTIADGMDADDLDDAINEKDKFADLKEDGGSLYYFGNSEDSDGALKTGSTTVTLDGDSYNFTFSKTGGTEGKGKGLTGIDDNKYIYKFGLKLKADSDDKYLVVYATGDTGSDSVDVQKISSSKMRSIAMTATGKNKDGDTVKFFGNMPENYRLVNTSGAIVKNKTAGKDGNDWYFYVDGNEIKMYTNNKSLTADKNDTLTDGAGAELKNWNKDGVTISAPDFSLSEIEDK